MAETVRSAKPVPPACQGLWQRTVLDVPGQPRDTTTQVYWLQTPHWHGDLRVPAARPGFAGIRSLAGCSPAQLAALLGQQGFAGITTVDGDICRWHRRIDYAASTKNDIGRLVFNAHGLDEWGVEATYYERWMPVAGAGTETDAQALGLGWNTAAGAPPERRQCLLRSGGWAMLLRDRPLAPEAVRTLQSALAAGAMPESLPREQLVAAADFEISLAHLGPDGWRVQLSTFPWREGQPLFPDLIPRGPTAPGPFHATPADPATGSLPAWPALPVTARNDLDPAGEAHVR